MKKPLIITHSGSFQPDDVFAVACLDLLHGGNYDLIRSRNMEVIKTGDFVVDVGDIYDATINRFDHHQKGGAGVRENGIPYSAFGLVWKHFGEKISSSKEIADEIEKRLVLAIDSDDNGIVIAESTRDIRPFYFTDALYAHAPSWKEDGETVDNLFKEAVVIAKSVLKRLIIKVRDEIESREAVEEAYRLAEDKRIIILDKPYSTHEILPKYPEPLFVIKPYRQSDDWRVKAVEDKPHAFHVRKTFPESWAAKRDAELAEASGVEGATFCHKDRWVAGAKTKEDAIELARKALE